MKVRAGLPLLLGVLEAEEESEAEEVEEDVEEPLELATLTEAVAARGEAVTKPVPLGLALPPLAVASNTSLGLPLLLGQTGVGVEVLPSRLLGLRREDGDTLGSLRVEEMVRVEKREKELVRIEE